MRAVSIYLSLILVALLTGCTLALEPPPADPAAEAQPAATPPQAEESATGEVAPEPSPDNLLRTDWLIGSFSAYYPWETICCSRLLDMIFTPLVTVQYDYSTAEITPLPELSLAWGWEANEDATAWTFQLREDVVWHNGEWLNTDDVIYTYELLLDPSFSGAQARFMQSLPIDFVEQVDDLTVTVYTTEPAPNLAEDLSHIWILPAHRLSQGAEDIFFAEELIGSGAFRFAGDVDGGVRLEANPDFFRGAPRIAYLDALQIDDMDERVMAALAGDVDVIHTDQSERSWIALDALRQSEEFFVTGYWAHSNRVQEITPLGNFLDGPAYHREELWYLTDSPAATPQEPMTPPGMRLAEHLDPLAPLLEANDLSADDFNLERAVAFPPDTDDFWQVAAPRTQFPFEDIEQMNEDGEILALLYNEDCVDAPGCFSSGQDLAIRIVRTEEFASGFAAEYLLWDDEIGEELVVATEEAQVTRDLSPVDLSSVTFAIGNSHSIKIRGDGVDIDVPVPWHKDDD